MQSTTRKAGFSGFTRSTSLLGNQTVFPPFLNVGRSNKLKPKPTAPEIETEEEMATQQDLQGDHSACTECRRRYPEPPTMMDIPHPPAFTSEMKEYVKYWEANQNPFRNPKTRRAISKGGRVWGKCERKYSEYKELQDPESWRNAKLQKALKEHEEDRKRDRDRCQQIHQRAVAHSWFDPAQGGKYTCTKCKREASKENKGRECHMCSDWPGGSCSCSCSLMLECKECKVKVRYAISGRYNCYDASEEDLKSSGRVRLEIYSCTVDYKLI